MVDVGERMHKKKTILSLDDVNTEQRNNHFLNLDMELIHCVHYQVLKQEKYIPKCLMALHEYIVHLSLSHKNLHEEILLDGYA